MAEPTTPSLWRTVKTVAWGFFGVRKGSSHKEDTARLTPLHVIGVGLVAVIVFVVALIVLVKFVVAA